MRTLTRESLALLLAASLAGAACRAQESSADAERAAALKEASDAIRGLVQKQTAEIGRMEDTMKAPPDMKGSQEASIKKLQEEAANPKTSEARRKQILEVELPHEKEEGKANEDGLKKLKQLHDRMIADRKAMQNKLTELETQLQQCASAKEEKKAEPKAESQAPPAPEAKAAP